jgi:protein-S-isoprenylcysteine O-methyltransferase
MAPHDETAGPTASAHASASSSSSASSASSASSSPASSPEHRAGPTIHLADLAPDGKISLTGISLESCVLGALLGAGASWTAYFLVLAPSRLWRAPAFGALLAAFHFCEFYVYARWNLLHARRDSFLTRSNGVHYQYAMAVALLETLVASAAFPGWQAMWSARWVQLVGALLVVGGQGLRHAAIATAGTNFHHLLQRDRRPGHELVTTGPYAVLRHPSYFGFYWWAVGTQVLLGNPFSAAMFAGVLWHFFYRRTSGECLFRFCPCERPVPKAKSSREMMWAR